MADPNALELSQELPTPQEAAGVPGPQTPAASRDGGLPSNWLTTLGLGLSGMAGGIKGDFTLPISMLYMQQRAAADKVKAEQQKREQLGQSLDFAIKMDAMLPPRDKRRTDPSLTGHLGPFKDLLEDKDLQGQLGTFADKAVQMGVVTREEYLTMRPGERKTFQEYAFPFVKEQLKQDWVANQVAKLEAIPEASRSPAQQHSLALLQVELNKASEQASKASEAASTARIAKETTQEQIRQKELETEKQEALAKFVTPQATATLEATQEQAAASKQKTILETHYATTLTNAVKAGKRPEPGTVGRDLYDKVLTDPELRETRSQLEALRTQLAIDKTDYGLIAGLVKMGIMDDAAVLKYFESRGATVESKSAIGRFFDLFRGRAGQVITELPPTPQAGGKVAPPVTSGKEIPAGLPTDYLGDRIQDPSTGRFARWDAKQKKYLLEK